jgi:hypothetical protein
MKAEEYSDYVSYDIQKYYSVKPEGPITCQMCAGNLSKTAIEPSKAMNDFNVSTEVSYWLDYGSSFLYTCNECHWWCVREHYEYVIRKFADHKFGRDYLIVSKTKNEKSKAFSDPLVNHAQPWLKALGDPKVYDEVQAFPGELAVLFKGGVIRKKYK